MSATKPRFTYHRYFKELSQFSDDLDVYQATRSSRFGLKKARDIFIVGRNYYGEGNYYIGILKDFVYLLALIPLILISMGLNTNLAIYFATLYVILCMIMGYASYRWLKFARSDSEYIDKMSANKFLMWNMIKQILDNQKKQNIQIKTKKRKK